MDAAAVVRVRTPAIASAGGGSDLERSLLFQIQAVELPAPVREFHFAWCCEHPRKVHLKGLIKPWHPFWRDRAWRLDFAWPTQRLAVEVQGGLFVQGRHTRGAALAAEYERHNEATLRNWRVLYVTAEQIADGSALAWIERALGGSAT